MQPPPRFVLPRSPAWLCSLLNHFSSHAGVTTTQAENQNLFQHRRRKGDDGSTQRDRHDLLFTPYSTMSSSGFRGSQQAYNQFRQMLMAQTRGGGGGGGGSRFPGGPGRLLAGGGGLVALVVAGVAVNASLFNGENEGKTRTDA